MMILQRQLKVMRQMVLAILITMTKILTLFKEFCQNRVSQCHQNGRKPSIYAEYARVAELVDAADLKIDLSTL